MADPASGIIGDNTGVDLPQMQVDEQTLVEEKKMAKYSKTAEFKRIQQHFEERIKFYQTFLPDGRTVVESPPAELGDKWLTANAVIAEFQAVMNMFEIANDAVEDDAKKNG